MGCPTGKIAIFRIRQSDTYVIDQISYTNVVYQLADGKTWPLGNNHVISFYAGDIETPHYTLPLPVVINVELKIIHLITWSYISSANNFYISISIQYSNVLSCKNVQRFVMRIVIGGRNVKYHIKRSGWSGIYSHHILLWMGEWFERIYECSFPNCSIFVKPRLSHSSISINTFLMPSIILVFEHFWLIKGFLVCRVIRSIIHCKIVFIDSPLWHICYK